MEKNISYKNIEDSIINTISEYTNMGCTNLNNDLILDLALNPFDIFEIFNIIANNYNINIGELNNQYKSINTVKDIIDFVFKLLN